MKKRFKIAVLGCRTNQYEGQAFADQLKTLGWEEAGQEQADLCIVNTCTVTASADQRSLAEVRKLKRDNPEAEIVVTGCMAEEKKDALLKMAGVKDVVINRDKESLVARLFPESEVPEFAIQHFEAHTRAFIKVQDGCNSYCSYCVIPLVRGRSRSRPLQEVIAEAQGLIENGYKELVITGINVGDYDQPSLTALVREIDQLEGLYRLRISSIDPDEVDDALLDAVIHGKRTCNSMHIVLQSGSNYILQRMRRKYTRQEFISAFERLRSADPDFMLTTDIIVGFPGETEADFADTLEMVDRVGFAKVHMFPFSARPKTRAARMDGVVPKEVIDYRRNTLMRRSEQVAFRERERFVGRTLQVLGEAGEMGHTTNFLAVKAPHLRPNALALVKILENTPEGLSGVVLDEGADHAVYSPHL